MNRFIAAIILLAASCLQGFGQTGNIITVNTAADMVASTVYSYATNRTVVVRSGGAAGVYNFALGDTTATNTTGVFASTGVAGRWLKMDLSGGSADLSAKLNATNGTAVNLTGTVTNVTLAGTLTPASPASRTFSTDADTLYTVGDSFTFGASATSYTNTYVSKLAASLGLSAVNIANGSFSIADANWIIFPGWTVTNSTGPSSHVFSSPSAITEDQNWTTLIGFNDLRTGAGTGTAPSAARYRLGLDHLLRYVAIPDTAKRWAVSPDASTGTWTPSTWVAYTNKAASSSSGTLTFSNVIGSEIYVGFVSWATNYGGTISVTVDGVSVESRSVASAAYGNREYINGSDPVIPDHLGPYGNGKLDFCPHVISATGLGLSAHTVVVTAASAPVTVIWAAGNGWKRTLREGPNVFAGSIPRQSPWTGAGTDALQASYNLQLRSAINTARSAGLRVAWAPVGEYYNPATEQDVDGVHPTNTGHTTIAGAFEQAMSGEMPQMADVGYQTEPSQNGSFTTLSVSGTSTLTGNATLGGRLLVLPTAGAGGTSSRFGFGSVAASGVNIVHSDTSLDRSLTILGNSISASVNSTGAGANLGLGTIGFTTSIAGDASVANVLTVVSNMTTTGRLLVTPVTQSGGHVHRFGQDSVGASAVQIVTGDTALDRRLTINGNSVSAAVNSTGASANLALGTSGNTVAIAGSASVAQTLTASDTIELGHASDTTLSRSAAGRITVEGNEVPSPASPTTGQIIVYTNSTWTAMTPGASGIGGSTGSTDNSLLRADGTGGSTLQNSAVIIDDYTSSTANNVAIKVDDGSTANISAVVTPKGNGAFILGPKPDGAATGGSARGQYAVDLQMSRSASYLVASGNNSFVAGANSYASANNTVAISSFGSATATGAAVIGGSGITASGQYAGVLAGFGSVASGSQSVFLAGQGSATATYAVGTGESLSDKQGMFAISGGSFATSGDSQTGTITLRNSTSSTTPTVLFANGSSARLTIPNDRFWTFTALVSGTTATGTSERYSYKLEGCIGKGTTAGSTSMPAAVTKTVIYEANASADVDATADTTNGALSITVTAANSTATRWSATVIWNQVGFP